MDETGFEPDLPSNKVVGATGSKSAYHRGQKSQQYSTSFSRALPPFLVSSVKSLDYDVLIEEWVDAGKVWPPPRG
jgi:hypothetical protein